MTLFSFEDIVSSNSTVSNNYNINEVSSYTY
jgi:hypothetical protein